MNETRIIALSLSFIIPLLWTITILLLRNMKHASTRQLFYLFLTIAFMCGMVYAKFMGYIELYSLLFPIQALACASCFTLFYLYVYVLTSEKVVFGWKYYIHFIMPVFFLVSTFIIFNVALNREEQIFIWKHILQSKPLTEPKHIFANNFYKISKFYFIIYSVFYMVLAYFRYISYRQHIANIFSSDKNKELLWIKATSYLFILTVVFNIIIQYMRNIDIGSNNLMISISYFVFSLFFWFLGLFGYMQKDIYDEKKVSGSEGFISETKINKEDIKKYLEKDKPYLDPGISIYDFSYIFSTNRTYLSETINKAFNMNFRTLINTYRIKEAKEIIKEAKIISKRIMLEDISIQSGFNNYNSFLRVFKSIEGIHPSDYIRSS